MGRYKGLGFSFIGVEGGGLEFHRLILLVNLKCDGKYLPRKREKKKKKRVKVSETKEPGANVGTFECFIQTYGWHCD